MIFWCTLSPGRDFRVPTPLNPWYIYPLMGCNSTDVGVAGEKRTNAQVWEEMRRLQRLGTEAIDTEAIDAATAEALRQAQMSPFEGLPDKVRRIAYL